MRDSQAAESLTTPNFSRRKPCPTLLRFYKNFNLPTLMRGLCSAVLYLNVSKMHLEQLRARGAGPNFCRPADSKIVRYRRKDLDAWMSGPSVYERRGFIQV
jgi:hypothetical protein